MAYVFNACVSMFFHARIRLVQACTATLKTCLHSCRTFPMLQCLRRVMPNCIVHTGWSEFTCLCFAIKIQKPLRFASRCELGHVCTSSEEVVGIGPGGVGHRISARCIHARHLVVHGDVPLQRPARHVPSGCRLAPHARGVFEAQTCIAGSTCDACQPMPCLLEVPLGVGGFVCEFD